jgi:hypothetical protein
MKKLKPTPLRRSSDLQFRATLLEPKHPTIDYYFNVAIHIIRRSNELADESKSLMIRLLILALVIVHCIAVLTK